MVHREQADVVAFLREENRVLKVHVAGRPLRSMTATAARSVRKLRRIVPAIERRRDSAADGARRAAGLAQSRATRTNATPVLIDDSILEVAAVVLEPERTFARNTSLGPYRIEGLIGADGTGEVYRARDTNLNRDVALKILPDVFVHDGDRLARFMREAQVLASLNHPNIGAIYGSKEGARLSSSSSKGRRLPSASHGERSP